jgi:SAM-dependent methyltransferase
MKNNLHEINVCEVCGNNELTTVLDLGLHPMCDDLVPVGDDRICREYPIEILYCKECRTAHQRFQIPKQDLFPVSYHYRSRFTADVLKGMELLVSSCIDRFGDISGKKVLDIGCNDGSLLDFFRQQGAYTVGVEPTGACNDAAEKKHMVFNDYLSPELAQQIVASHGSPDFITFTNVFAHIEDLNGVLESLKILMRPETVLVIENHYLGSVLDGNQFDTFYHEHPRTYSYTSFLYMARTLNTELLDVEFPSRYGGNIRVFLGTCSIASENSDVDRNTIDRRESHFFDDFASLRNNIEFWRNSKRRFLQHQVKEHGLMLAKAFPGRAAILVKLLGLTEKMISIVYEKPGSMKIGHYLPGTRIPIHSDDELFSVQDKNQPILNLAWHISSEIRAYMADHGFDNIVDILNTEDFNNTNMNKNRNRDA